MRNASGRIVPARAVSLRERGQMMQAAYSNPPTDWSRRAVKEIAAPEWPTLQGDHRAWLLLNGAHSETVEAEVRALATRFDYHWVWRGTAQEYRHPGYRRGPMLLPLTERVLQHLISNWGPQAGVILSGGDDDSELLRHLRQLHQLIAEDGLPVSFSFFATRHLEELFEALPVLRTAELLGPIKAVAWRLPDDQGGRWLRSHNASEQPSCLAPDQFFTLTHVEESALDHASLAWFMRDSMRHFTQRDSRWAGSANQLELSRQLAIFSGEAEKLHLRLERDVRHYMTLRLAYSQAPFVTDTVLRTLLSQHHVAGLQRMYAAEDRLRQTVDSTTPGSFS